MYFKNEKHQELFTKAIKKMDQKDNVQMSVVYLLTADKKTWQRCRSYMIDQKIPIHKVRIGESTKEGYALFCLPCYVFKESDMYQINYWLIGGGYTKKKRIHSENKGKYVCILDIGLEYEFAGYGDSQSKSRRETARLVYDYLNENGLLTSIEDEIGEPCIDRAINQLQELSQKGYCEIPEYKFKETHDSNGNPRWVCECCVEDQEYTYSSESSSKKTAKKRAAYFMLLYVLGFEPQRRF